MNGGADMVDNELGYRPDWAERVFMLACELNLDPPQRCPGCHGRLEWGMRELNALHACEAMRCPHCRFDLREDREQHPLRYAMEP